MPFDPTQPYETVSVAEPPAFDPSKPFERVDEPAPAPRFDTSKVKLDPYQKSYLATGTTDPSRDPSMSPIDIISGRGGSDESAANVYRTTSSLPQLASDLVGKAAAGVGNIPARVLRGAEQFAGIEPPTRGVVTTDETGKQVLKSEPAPLPFQAGVPLLKKGPFVNEETDPVNSLLNKLIQGSTTPEMIATLPLAESELVKAFFLTQTVPGAIEGAKVALDPTKTPKERYEGAMSGGVNSLFSYLLAHRPSAAPGELQGPPATGAVLQTPRGALPPSFETGKALGPQPLPRGKPVVPETAPEPERNLNVLEEIRQKGLKTREQVKANFPQAGLSNERASALLKQAWNNPQPTTPTPNARQIQTPATVHGNLQSQPVESPGPVPVPESGPGIQPQTETRLPETPPGQVPLKQTRMSKAKAADFKNWARGKTVQELRQLREDHETDKIASSDHAVEIINEVIAEKSASLKMTVASETPQTGNKVDTSPFLKVPEVDPGDLKETIRSLDTSRQDLRKQQADIEARIKELAKKVTYQTGPSYQRGRIKPSAPKGLLKEYQDLRAKHTQLGQSAGMIEEQIRQRGTPVANFKLQQRVNNPNLPLMARLMARRELFYAEGGKPPDELGSAVRAEADRLTREKFPDATETELRAVESAVTRAAMGNGDMEAAWRLDPELKINEMRRKEIAAVWQEATRNDLAHDFSTDLKAQVGPALGLYGEKIQTELSRATTDELIGRIQKETETVQKKRAVEQEAANKAAVEMEQKFTTVIETEAVTSGKAAKDKLVGALQTALEKAPEEPAGKATVTIKIPGDGTFKIFNDKQQIAHVLGEAQKLETGKGGKFTPLKRKPYEAGTQTDVGRALEIYKTSGNAYRTLAGQLRMAKELELSPEQTERLGEVVRWLENSIRSDWQTARRTLSQAEDRAEFLAKQFGPESKEVKANQTNIEAYEKKVKEEQIKMEAELGPQPTAPGQGKVMGFGGAVKPGPTTVPVATTPSQVANLIKTKTPGLNIVRGVMSGIKSLLLPTANSPEHLRAAEKFGAKLGAMNHQAESSAFALDPSSKFFDRRGVHNENLPPDKNPGIKFMSDMSQGRPMPGQYGQIARLIQKLFQERLVLLEKAGAALQSVRQNYFPGMWTNESRLAFNAAMDEAVSKGIIGKDADVNAATPQQKAWVKARVDEHLKAGTGSEADMMGYLTRSPLKGRETFRKQKVFDDIMDGAEFGLRPISNNPIDLVKLKLAEMDKSIMGNEFFRELESEGELKVISPYEDTPEGWVRLNDKYGTIYGPPTVTIPEHLDKSVYEGLLDFAGKLGIKHERSMKFPSGPGQRALGLSYQGQDFVRTKFATETSVLAHEIFHQLDHKYDLWGRIVTEAVGLGKKGVQTKGASQKMRGKLKAELRAIADLTGNRGGDPRKREEQIAQMGEAYVHAPEKMREVAPTVFKVLDDFIHSKPELKGLADIKPGIELEKLTSEKYVGLPIKGYRIVPKATGDIVNNYLSSSIYNSKGLGKLYQGWMFAANALNQSQLGLGSAFHAGFTTADVQVSAGASLIKDLYGVVRGNRSMGDLGKTLKNWTVASAKTAVTGDKVLNAWRNPDGVIDPRIAQVVKATELAGGGYKLEHGLQTEQTTKLVRDWYSDSKVRAAGRSPVALTELSMKPIMDYLVPRQKAGVFADLAWRIIDQNPGKPLEELTPQFRQAWNRVDARLGQVRYNRLFMNNTAKGLIQGLVRAPGWSGGTIAEIGGSFPDAAKYFQEWIKTGKAPADIPDRVAYTMSLLATIGTANAVLTYAFTGQVPHGMDFMAFRTGRKDKDGNDERFLLPTYVKDILAYSKQPGVTVMNKTTPLASMFNEVVIKNRDYYGYEIRNPNAPASEQAGQVGKYVIKSFEPFWTRGARKSAQAGVNPGRVVAPYFGVMPAPAYITRSAIQNEISELYHKRTGERLKPYDARTADEAKRSARDASNMDVYMFKRLPKSDQEALARKMSPEEKERYGMGGSSGSLPWQVNAP